MHVQVRLGTSQGDTSDKDSKRPPQALPVYSPSRLWSTIAHVGRYLTMTIKAFYRNLYYAT